MENLVKCNGCGYVFKTKADVTEETQCSVSNGCGKRFPVKGNLVKV